MSAPSRPAAAPTAPGTTSDTERRLGVAAPARTFRPELQGLRALAVGLVVVYHVWFGRVSGGVDVFFLVTGFLLTGQLARAAERGPLHLARRWSRTALRLMPAALTVLLVTMGASVALLPEARWTQTVREVIASSLFLENWQLAADSVDYTASHNTASVAQHFWSLSIQGQFSLVWPLVVALMALVARSATPRLHSYLTLALLGAFAASLTLSIAMTDTDQPLAYFHSLTRLWEFALGGLLALWIDRIALSRTIRVIAGWAGVAGLIACGAVLQVGSVFPGFAALWPTSCAVLVLIAGTTGRRLGADQLLASRPAQYLGGLAYTLYLCHWPVLVLYLASTGTEGVGLLDGVLVIAVSIVAAVAVHHCVEKPVLARGLSVGNAYRFCGAGLVVVVLAASGWQFATAARAVPKGIIGDPIHPGAAALYTESTEPAPLLPPLVSVTEDWVRIEHWNCAPMAEFPMDACTQQVPEPDRRIVVVGDSHMQQFIGALVPIAAQHNWQLTSIVRGACPFSTAAEVVPDDVECLDWNTAAAGEIAALRPDAVFTLASRDVRPGLTEQTPSGFVDQWRRLDELGIRVVAVRDNPRFDYQVPDCVAQNDHDPNVCGVDRAEVYSGEPPYLHVPDMPRNVRFLDVADAVCDATRCPVEVGNVLVYMDDNHLTASYTATMAAPLEARVLTALDW